MAVNSSAGRLYLSQPGVLEVRSAATGALLGSILDPSISDPTGVCLSPLPTDHYKCYKGKNTTPQFLPTMVALTDQFETGKQTEVKKPFMFCNPVDKNGEGIEGVDNHLECYKIKDVTGQAKFAGATVTSVNQFGFEDLELKKAKLLCAPSEKNGKAADLNINHFKCYQGKNPTAGPAFRPTTVTLTDQFETGKQTEVKKPFMFCNPVDKNGEGIENANNHVECYKVKGVKGQAKFTGATITSDNQFGTEGLELKKANLLCVPSQKFLNPTCGDEVVNRVSEECDGKGDLCASEICAPDCTCAAPTCGDDIVNQQSEECDGTDDDACPGDCLPDCTCAVCGNNIAEPPMEECDGTDDSMCPGLCTAGCVCGVIEDLTTCDPRVTDTWDFTVASGEAVVITGDTVDAPTAADLCFEFTCTTGDSGGGDDNFACTFPPPDYSCPRATFTASGDGTCTVSFTVCSTSCADPAKANYQLRVTRNWTYTSLILTGDDL